VPEEQRDVPQPLPTRVEELEAEVDRLSKELDIARNDLHEAWAQLRELRTSTSWRITAPLRAVRRRQVRGR
jgi:hypothetical protein